MEGIDRFLLAISSLAIGIIGLLFLKQAVSLHWRRLTLATLIWYTYFFFLFIPSIWIAVYEEPPEGYRTLALVLSAAITIPIGVLGANAVWRFRRQEITRFYYTSIEPCDFSERKALFILTILALLLSGFFFIEIKTIPILYAFTHPGEPHTFTLLRQYATKELSSPFRYPYFMLRQFGWSLIISCWFGITWLNRNNKRKWFFFLSLLGIALFYNIAVLAKHPPLILLGSLGITYYLYRGGRIKIMILGLLVGLACAIPFSIILLYTPQIPINSIWNATAKRSFYVPARMNFYYIHIYQNKQEFLWGRSIGKLANIVNLFDPSYEYVSSSEDTYRFLFPNSPYKGSANTSFIGTAYANWGIFGPPIYGLVIGLISQSLQIWLIRQKKTIFLIGVQSGLFISFAHLIITDLFTVMFSGGGLVLPLILALGRVKWRFPSAPLRVQLQKSAECEKTTPTCSSQQIETLAKYPHGC